MAPYVEREWGSKATELMWRLKALADPDGVLSPGVLLNRDPGVHLRNLKTTPEIEEVATTCVECGFCEPVCPSRNLTTTPRQRIVIRREMARQAAGSPVQRALLEQFEYDGIQTCAADGTCQIACPLGIDTGKLVKGFRAREHTPRAQRQAAKVAEGFKKFEALARAGLRTGAAAGPLMRAWSGVTRALVSDELVPAWPRNMPPPAPAKLPKTSRDAAAAVYMPACVNRIFGPPRGNGAGLHLPEAMVALSTRAGKPVWIPGDVGGHCCSVPWSSKGYTEGAGLMANRTVAALWDWSGEGALPIVIDASSCALGLSSEVADDLTEENRERHEKLEILDSVSWTKRLLPNLPPRQRLRSVAVHPTCSTRHLGLERELREIAGEMANEVVQPIRATCCGMAGDRGLLHPELTASASAEEAAELAGSRHDAYLCSNRTCEIGLQAGTGAPYESFVIPLERISRQ
jgi:D-lactate dehydrogenase